MYGKDSESLKSYKTILSPIRGVNQMIILLLAIEGFIVYILNEFFAKKKYEDTNIPLSLFKNLPYKYLNDKKSESKVRRVLGQHSITPN